MPQSSHPPKPTALFDSRSFSRLNWLAGRRALRSSIGAKWGRVRRSSKGANEDRVLRSSEGAKEEAPARPLFAARSLNSHPSTLSSVLFRSLNPQLSTLNSARITIPLCCTHPRPQLTPASTPARPVGPAPKSATSASTHLSIRFDPLSKIHPKASGSMWNIEVDPMSMAAARRPTPICLKISKNSRLTSVHPPSRDGLIAHRSSLSDSPAILPHAPDSVMSGDFVHSAFYRY